jgi:nucleoid-associated protein YgaU
MGLIDFVKSAGESLLERVQGNTAAESEAITKAVADHGLSVDGLRVEVDGDVAKVSGKALTQAEREKAILVAGNTQGIARVEDSIDVEKPEPASTYYEVKKGDSLSKIAKAHYGDAMKYPQIFEANRPMLKDPDKIYPGQVLRLPPL